MTGGCAGGLLIGAAIGAIIGTAAAGSEESFFPMGRETYILFYAIPLSILGGCVGGTGKALEGKDQHSDLTQMSYRQKIDLLIRLSGL
jgi:hypothetical protein